MAKKIVPSGPSKSRSSLSRQTLQIQPGLVHATFRVNFENDPEPSEEHTRPRTHEDRDYHLSLRDTLFDTLFGSIWLY